MSFWSGEWIGGEEDDEYECEHEYGGGEAGEKRGYSGGD